MRFKVEPKAFMLFIFYCFILLYFCAIAVLNFISFSQNGTFYGLLPFKAFTFEYIGYTIGLFIAVLVLIFTSVSSYIFDKEKGFGFGIHLSEKSSDGYSKWASEKDIKNDKGIVKVSPLDKDIKAAGIPLINKGTEIWVDNGEYHNLVIGATGSGKTECVVKPLVNLLSKKGESMIITDPKGEIYEYCGEYLRSQGYKIVILNFREPEKGNAWNPLSLPYQYYKSGNMDKGIELLDDVALNILYDKSNGKSDSEFWEKSAADYFSGLALGLFMDAKEKEVNLNSINYMSTVGEERRGTTPYIKEYFSLKGEDSSAYIFASNTINAPNETKGGILSTFRQKIRLFSTRESLSEMLAYSDFDMRDIGKQKTAVFMIIHDEKKTYHGLMTIFVKQCYETLIDCAQANGGKLEYRTNFILDEFANMPPLKDVDAMVTAARSRDIRFTFIIQNFAQLNEVYGEEIAQVVKGNCGNLVYLISTELKALEEISKMCGEVKSKEKDKTASTPLVTVSDLQKLKLFEAIIIRWRKNPFKTKLTPDFKIDWGVKYGKAELPTRQIQKIELFDIKKFVSEKKKDDELNNPRSFAGANPFLSGGFNPFIQSSPNISPMPAQDRRNMANISDKEIDDMVKDIEKKLAALDEEEKRNQEKAKTEKKEKNPNILIPDDFDDELEDNEPVIKPVKKELPPDNFTIEDALKQIEEKEKGKKKAKEIINDLKDDDLSLTKEIKLDDLDKPIINVDKDSVVVNENVITDDEYYDDFFD
ncbi:MAG: type IV secretory system conjugative DNA transfer family protein [Bacilli bacterium]|nr:type IV secretory system conjugative DNA transfer family protein [Bacilli bacterium]